MIVVKIELHSAVDRGVRELGRLTIENLGRSAQAEGFYDYLCRVEIPEKAATFPRYGLFRINNYFRHDGFLKLVKKAIDRINEELGYATESRES